MSTAISRRRGTTVQHSTFTGLVAEVTIDTDKNVAVIHDGTTPGGHPLAPESLVPGGLLGQILAIGAGGAREWVDNVGYDSGPWTPSFAFGTGAVGQTYSEQSGGYIRIGNFVFLWFRVQLTNKGTSTGTATLEGFPHQIAPLGGGGVGSLNVGYYTGMALPGPGISGFPSSGTNVTLRNQGAATTSGLSDAHFTNTSFLIGSISYEAAP